MHTIMFMAIAAFTTANDPLSERVAAPMAIQPSFTITGIAKDPPANLRYFQVRSSTDNDGNGLGDEAILRISCSNGHVSQASYRSQEDNGGATSSGKRTHHPVTFVKEWGPSTPKLAARTVGYNVKSNDKARTAAPAPAEPAGWTQIDLTGEDELCSAAVASPVALPAGPGCDDGACFHAINTKGTGTSGRVAKGDLDCDGVAASDVTAAAGPTAADAAYNVKSPRDSASGQASGKRVADACLAIKTKGVPVRN